MRNRATTPLKRAKFRMSMSKYNLYGLSRLILPAYKTRTFYQQKWSAKSVLRQYHGEQVREGQWSRMFSRRLRSVVPMDPAYLAKNDGSVESAGRGRGLDVLEERVKGPRTSTDRKKEVELTPYMNMTFAPLERRLDVAIFRALFASSARQAKQFVVHGDVKVNGQVMRFPGYLLNPGDMFQVEPDRVMFAMARKKPRVTLSQKKEVRKIFKGTTRARSVASMKCFNCGEKGHVTTDCPKPSICKTCSQEGHVAADCPKRIDAVRDQTSAAPLEQTAEAVQEKRDGLKQLQKRVKSTLASRREPLSAKQKQEMREFSQTVRKAMSRAGNEDILPASLDSRFEEIRDRFRTQRQAKEQGQSLGPSQQAGATATGAAEPAIQAPIPAAGSGAAVIADAASEEEPNALLKALRELPENSRDVTKPYPTPWMPRNFMSAFAFIPRYLEVNQNICAAVYLRHPVARPGLAEVPTPYPEPVNASAFGWYLRRR